MQMPKGVEWAAHSLVVLEVLGGRHAVTSAKLAQIYGLSPTYLNKHLQQMAAHGLLASTSGPSGGFTLTRPGSQITLAHVVAAFDDEPIFRCGEIRCGGIFTDRANEFRSRGLCGINAAMLRAENAWRDALAAVTIADLAAHVDARSREEITRFAGSSSTEKGTHQ